MSGHKISQLFLCILGGWVLLQPANALPLDYAHPATTPGKAYFGMELTFTNETLLGSDKVKNPGTYEAAIEKWVKVAEQRCAKTQACTVERKFYNPITSIIDGPTVYFRHKDDKKKDWWYIITIDYGVLEILTRPTTLQQAQILAPLINDHLFGTAAAAGLQPHAYVGGGHIHIDAETAFGNNTVAFTNFVTEIHNIGMWPMRKRIRSVMVNAPPMSFHEDETQMKYDALAASIARGSNDNISQLGEKMREIYLTSPRPRSIAADGEDNYREQPGKYQAINLETFTSPTRNIYSGPARDLISKRPIKSRVAMQAATIEIRSIDPQQNTRDLMVMLTVLQKAIDHANADAGVKRYVQIRLNPDAPNYDLVTQNYASYLRRISATPEEIGILLQYAPKEVADRFR